MRKAAVPAPWLSHLPIKADPELRGKMRRCLHCEVCSCSLKPPSQLSDHNGEPLALHGKGEQADSCPLLSCSIQLGSDL